MSLPALALENDKSPDAAYSISDEDFVGSFRAFYEKRIHDKYKDRFSSYTVEVIDRSNPRMILVLVRFGDTANSERFEVCRVDTRTLRRPNDVGRLAYSNYINTRSSPEVEAYLARRKEQRAQKQLDREWGTVP